MKKEWLRVKTKSLLRKPRIRKTLQVTAYGLISIALILTGIIGGYFWGSSIGQTSVWDRLSITENQLRDLYSNSTQTGLTAWLPNVQMNFMDGLIWESQGMSYTENRPQYQNVLQVLNDKKGACGEFVWVYGAFCVANNIPFRIVTVGYFVPNVADHAWVQVNPSHDGKTWIHVEVTDTCSLLSDGKTIDQLWNQTINNNSYYFKYNYKMVQAYELNENGEVIITDATSTFSPLKS
jgi:uncharacterized protein YneF (UPF0154 family)